MKICLPLIILSIITWQASAQTVSTGPVPSPICAGTSFDLAFTTVGSFSPGNYFTVQISDANGSFSQQAFLGGNYYTDTTGSLQITIPQNQPAGTGYRFRLISSLPATTGADNGVDITITQIPAAPVLTISGNACAGADSLTISHAPGAVEYSWYNNLYGYNVVAAHGPYQGTIVAGGNDTGTLLNQLNNPSGLFVDNSGNLYVSEALNNRVLKFAPGSTQASNGVVVAGGNGSGSAANQFNFAGNMFVDVNGNLYVDDAGNNRIQMFPPGSTSATNGITVAGGNGPGNAANQLNGPSSVYVDGAGNIYVADASNNRIQKFPAGSTSATQGVTVAGGNGAGNGANQLDLPYDVYLDTAGNIYVADYNYSRIQKFPANSTQATNGVTVAGGSAGPNANQLDGPVALFIDTPGNIYVADYYNNRIQKFAPGGSTVTDGITLISGVSPGEVFVTGTGTIYVADDANNAVEKFTAATPDSVYIPTNGSLQYWASYSQGGCISANSDTITVKSNTTFVSAFAYTNPICYGQVDSFMATANNGGANPTFQWYINNTLAGSNSPRFGTNTLNVGDTVKVKLTSNAVCAVGATSTADIEVTVNPTPPAAQLVLDGHCLGHDTLVLHADGAEGVVWYNETAQANASFDAYTVAGGVGSGTNYNQIADGIDIFVDKASNVYVADYGASRVLKFAAGSTAGSPGTIVAMNGLLLPAGIWVDNNNNLFVSDILNNVVLKYPAGSDSTTPGIVVAGRPIGGNTAGLLNQPAGIYIDNAGNLYVADSYNGRVQKFPAGSDSTTNAVTVAQNGLVTPMGVYKDSAGYLYVADQTNSVVKKYPSNSFNLSSGITLGAGQLNATYRVYTDNAGNLYAQDSYHVLKFPHNSTSGTVGKTVAGSSEPGSSFTQLNGGGGLFVDSTGSIYVGDRYNNRVQKFVPGLPDTTYIVDAAGSYTATYVSGYGCTSAVSNPILINPGIVPVVTRSGDTLSTTSYPGYQWLDNGVVFDNATGQNFVVAHSGYYSVVVTDNTGCQDTSAAVNVTFAAINNIGKNNTGIYPNPNNSAFMLESNNCVGSTFVISDLLGQTIYEQVITSNKQPVHVSNLAAGTYLLQIKGDSTGALKFVVN